MPLERVKAIGETEEVLDGEGPTVRKPVSVSLTKALPSKHRYFAPFLRSLLYTSLLIVVFLPFSCLCLCIALVVRFSVPFLLALILSLKRGSQENLKD